MSRDEEIREILIDLLQIGLLRVRALSSDGHSKECFIEADHLHNLPELIKSLQPELLAYYWNVERPGFIKQTQNAEEFEPHWQKLAKNSWITDSASPNDAPSRAQARELLRWSYGLKMNEALILYFFGSHREGNCGCL